MIHIENGNLFNCQADAYINTVNCVGVMGKGIALQFKLKYPDMYKEYREICNNNELEPGILHVWYRGVYGLSPKYIINFPTKVNWRNPSKIGWIEKGLCKLQDVIRKLNLKSIAIPALGCSNGGLDWNVVRPIIESYLKNINCEIYLYEPN